MRKRFAGMFFGVWLVCCGLAVGDDLPADFWRNQSIYQVITDRFFNGDASNDSAGGRHAPGRPWAVHGGDFAGIVAKLDYIRALGATALWISPVLLNGCGAYHAYATTDFYRIHPAFGTKEELQNLIREAHRRGLLVIGDVVVNHGGQWVDSGDEGWPDFRKPPGGYALRMREGKRYAPPFDHVALGVPLEEIFNTNGRTEEWGDPQQVELGELMGLDDFRTTSPYIREKMREIYTHWIREIGFDAFRIDTAKHVEMEFWDGWCAPMREAAKAAGHDHFFIFGEVYEDSDEKCGLYTGRMAGGSFKMDSVLDYPLYYKIEGLFAKATSPTNLVEKRHAAITKNHYDPASHMALVTFLDNHDRPRFLAAAGATPKRLEVALAFLHTARGIPCLYYGTEQDFNGGNDPFNRENMFDGAFESGPSEGDNFDMVHPRFLLTARLNNLRRIYPALRQGEDIPLRSDAEGSGILAYARRLGDEVVFVFLNTSDAEISSQIEHSGLAPGTVLVDAYGASSPLAVEASGEISGVTLAPSSFKILVPETQRRALDPVVTSCAPMHGDGSVSGNAKIRIRFSKAMDTDSVERAFSTVPAMEGTFDWGGGAASFSYTPKAPLPAGARVDLRLAADAADAEGLKMHAPFESFFLTTR